MLKEQNRALTSSPTSPRKQVLILITRKIILPRYPEALSANPRNLSPPLTNAKSTILTSLWLLKNISPPECSSNQSRQIYRLRASTKWLRIPCRFSTWVLKMPWVLMKKVLTSNISQLWKRNRIRNRHSVGNPRTEISLFRSRKSQNSNF